MRGGELLDKMELVDPAYVAAANSMGFARKRMVLGDIGINSGMKNGWQCGMIEEEP